MNAKIDMYTPEEVAKSVGVTSATICNWCREGLINANNVSDGTDKNRYEICEDELRYLRKLARQYGPKKVLLYYKKDWRTDTVELPVVNIDREYTALEMANLVKVDKTTVNKWCREDKIHHRSIKCKHGKGNIHYIPGWGVLYIKQIFDKYGHADGNISPMVLYYEKDVNKRGDKKMDNAGIPWVLDMDTEVPQESQILTAEDVKKQVSEVTEPDKVASNREEPSDDKLLDSFIRVRELKKDIDNTEAKLNQMKNEYAQLKGDIMAWL